MTNKTKAAIDIAKYELHMRQKAAIEEAAKDAFWQHKSESKIAIACFKMGAQEVIEHPERYGLATHKPLGIQEARELVNQMLAEEISFSRFVELINEGGVK